MFDGSTNEGFKIQLCWQFEMDGRDAINDVYPVNRERRLYSGQLYPRVRQARQPRIARHDLHAIPIEPIKAITVRHHIYYPNPLAIFLLPNLKGLHRHGSSFAPIHNPNTANSPAVATHPATR